MVVHLCEPFLPGQWSHVSSDASSLHSLEAFCHIVSKESSHQQVPVKRGKLRYKMDKSVLYNLVTGSPWRFRLLFSLLVFCNVPVEGI